MNLYLIDRSDPTDWDEWDGAVVAAKNEDEARATHPGSYPDWDGKGGGSWVNKEHVVVTYLGEAKPNTKSGVILSSFRAG